MFLPKIRRSGPEPIHRQIYGDVVRLVEDGSLRAGERLPPTRVLAARLGVNRSTVYRAYQELWASGYLESRPGSYSTVRARGVSARPARGAAKCLIDWEKASSPSGRRAHGDLGRMAAESTPQVGPRVVNFSRLAADRELCPAEDLRRAVRDVLVRQGKDLLDYGIPGGYPPLKETIARRMRVHGVSVSADEILVTSGAQHGLDLVLRLLTSPGARIAVESPTYALAVPLLRLHALRTVEIPMRSDGLDLGILEARISRERPALLYTIPNFHNPTGITTSQAHREALLALCERYRLPIVEDGFEEEMKYFGKAILPIKSMDARGIVIYLGTFSKVVFPGLRIGWIAAERGCIERLLPILRFSSLSGATLGQAALDRFCRMGGYEQHLRRIHKAYRRRMQALLRGLSAHLPKRGVEWTRPAGGYTLMIRIPGGQGGGARNGVPARGAGAHERLDEAALMEHLLRSGVAVTPGSLFYPTPPPELSFRLSIACLTEPEIEEGCRRLGRALAAIVRT